MSFVVAQTRVIKAYINFGLKQLCTLELEELFIVATRCPVRRGLVFIRHVGASCIDVWSWRYRAWTYFVLSC